MIKKSVKCFIPLQFRRLVGLLLEEFCFLITLALVLFERKDHKRADNLTIVSGFLNKGFGIGRASRYTIDALSKARVQSQTHDIEPILKKTKFFSSSLSDTLDNKYSPWIVHCNPPEAKRLIVRMKPSHWIKRYRIGYWAFELLEAPKEWLRVALLFDEIWVPSQFVADSLSALNVPVKIVPHYVTTNSNIVIQEFPLDKFGLSPADRLIVSAGDLRSSIVRKNLFGSIQIFQNAFNKPVKNIKLVLKISSADFQPEVLGQLRRAANQRSDIVFIQETFEPDHLLAFQKHWHLFLSPHKSEGFGLSIAESIFNNIPVLATAWSGNLEFMEGQIDNLISFSLVKVEDETKIYSDFENNLWASPNIDDATIKLKKLLFNKTLSNKNSKIAYKQLVQMNDSTIKKIALHPFLKK